MDRRDRRDRRDHRDRVVRPWHTNGRWRTMDLSPEVAKSPRAITGMCSSRRRSASEKRALYASIKISTSHPFSNAR